MLLTKSAVAFARVALAVTRSRLPVYRNKYSRHDFEWPQIVACLLVKQFFGLDYRGIEQLLREFSELRAALQLLQAPDHTTLCRGLRALELRHLEHLLDETVGRQQSLPRRRGRPPKMHTVIPDSTGLRWDQASRSYWRRIKKNPNFRRWPKWSIAVDRRTHVILGQVADEGPCSDHVEFERLIRDSQRRRPSTELLADAGYDSHKNFVLCKDLWSLSPVININMGRPTDALPTSPHRRAMVQRFPKRRYGQRWQVESAISAHKRRFGDSLRARSQARRRREQLLRGILHNCAVLRSRLSAEGRNRAIDSHIFALNNAGFPLARE